MLNVDYWATIVVYKNNKEIAKAIGITKKDDIYSLIKKENLMYYILLGIVLGFIFYLSDKYIF